MVRYYTLDKLYETRQNARRKRLGPTVEGNVDASEKLWWMALAAISGFVLVLLIFGPVTRAYKQWKIRRMFRLRNLSPNMRKRWKI